MFSFTRVYRLSEVIYDVDWQTGAIKGEDDQSAGAFSGSTDFVIVTIPTVKSLDIWLGKWYILLACWYISSISEVYIETNEHDSSSTNA